MKMREIIRYNTSWTYDCKVEMYLETINEIKKRLTNFYVNGGSSGWSYYKSDYPVVNASGSPAEKYTAWNIAFRNRDAHLWVEGMLYYYYDIGRVTIEIDDLQPKTDYPGWWNKH